MEAQVAVSCKLCVDGGTLEWQCITCGDVMCESCKVVHTRSSSSRHHEVVSIQEAFKQSESKGFIKDEHMKCCKHQYENFQLVCSKCQTLLCFVCLQEHEGNHTFEKIPEHIKEERLAVSQCSADVQMKLSDYSDAKVTIIQKKEKFKEETNKVVKQISQKSQILKSKIDISSQKMIDRLRQDEENYEKLLGENETQIDQNIDKISALSTKLQEKLATGDVSTTSDLVTTVRYKLSNYKENATPLEQHPLPFTSRDLEDNDLNDFIGHVGIPHHVDKDTNGNHTISESDITCEIEDTVSFPVCTNLVATVDQSKAWVGVSPGRRIRLVTRSGQVLKDVSAPFLIHNITVNSSGELLVSLSDGHKIQRLEHTEFKEVCDFNPFKTRGLFATKKSEIFVCLDTFNVSKIVRLSPYGVTLQTIQYHPDGQSQLFSYPYFVTESNNGNICVVDYNHQSTLYAVIVVDKNGILQFIYSGTLCNGLKSKFSPQEIQTDKYDNILISDCSNHTVTLLDRTGKFVQHLMTSNDGLKRPIGISVDDSGTLWVCSESDKKMFLVRYLK